jgi:hypothetical protein
MSDGSIEVVLTQAEGSELTLAQWLRVSAATGATTELAPDDARRLARRIDDVTQLTVAVSGWAVALGAACASMRTELVVLRCCGLVLAALNVIAWWL